MMIAALTIGGCAKGEDGEQAQQLAAQADSSAAGYSVGAAGAAADSDSTVGRRRDSTAVQASASAGARSSARGAAGDTTRATMSRPADVARAETTAARRGRTLPPAVTHPARIPPSRPGPDTPHTSRAASGPVGQVRVNEFLAYDAGAKTATVQLVGGYNGLNGALNFNGGAKGSQTITVPLGWKVQASFVNRDGDLPHSAIVVREVSPIPLEAPPPAFPRAFTVKLEEGLQEGGTDDLSFVANKEGRFLIFCGVPGHGQGGMWIYLVVSPSASAPTYQ
jgi:sulfocyanin